MSYKSQGFYHSDRRATSTGERGGRQKEEGGGGRHRGRRRERWKEEEGGIEGGGERGGRRKEEEGGIEGGGGRGERRKGRGRSEKGTEEEKAQVHARLSTCMHLTHTSVLDPTEIVCFNACICSLLLLTEIAPSALKC